MYKRQGRGLVVHLPLRLLSRHLQTPRPPVLGDVLARAELQHERAGKSPRRPIHSALPVPPDPDHGQLRVLLPQIVRVVGWREA